MKKVIFAEPASKSIAIAAMLILMAGVFLHAAEAAGPIPFKFGFVSNAKLQGGIYGQLIEKYVNESCKGRIEAKFFPNGLLGTDPEMLDKTRLGLIEGVIAPLNVAGNAVPYVDVLMLPFVSNNWDSVNAFAKSPFADEFLAGVENYGYKGLGLTGYGLSGLECNTKATTLEELQKLKFRVPEAPVIRKTFEALGITPMVIPFPDLYEALKQGVVDGCDLPPDVAVFVKFTEVIKYFVKTNHNFGWYMFMVNKPWFDRLPEDLKGPFTDAVKRASAESLELSHAAEMKALDEFAKKGIEVITLSDTEQEKMRQMTKPVIEWRLNAYNDKDRALALKTLDVMGYKQ